MRNADLCADVYVQTTVSVIFRMLTLLMYEPARGVIRHRGTGAPGDRERCFTLHELAVAKLEQRFVEATALLINCANYGLGARAPQATQTARHCSCALTHVVLLFVRRDKRALRARLF